MLDNVVQRGRDGAAQRIALVECIQLSGEWVRPADRLERQALDFRKKGGRFLQREMAIGFRRHCRIIITAFPLS